MRTLAQAYIERIRKPAKRIYATNYWAWLNGYREAEPSHGLTHMGAQAVRMELNQIYRETEDSEGGM